MSEKRQSAAEKQHAAANKGQSQKFAWLKEAGADPTLSDAAFRVLALCAIHEAGSKGYWTGKRVHLAKLCGVSVRKFDRAIAEGIKRNWIYTDDDSEDRRANTYHMWTVEDRVEMFYDELNEWKRDLQRAADERRQYFWNWLREWCKDVQSFFDAEKAFVQDWLDAEKAFIRDSKQEFHQAVYNAVYDRCGNHSHAWATADAGWEVHEAGNLTLEHALKTIADRPQDKFPEPDVRPGDAGNNVTESGNHRATDGNKVAKSGNYVAKSDEVVTTHGALTSGDNQSPCAQVLQVPQVLEEARAATPGGYAGALKEENHYPHPAAVGRPTAGVDVDLDAVLDAVAARALESMKPPRPAGGCALCGPAGLFRDPDGDPVVLFNEVDTEEEFVFCQHSWAGNVAEIRRIESASDGFWQLALTGYREIDSQFAHLANGEYSDWDGE